MSRKRIDSSEVGLTPRTVTRRDALRILIGAGMCAVLSPAIARAATTQEKLDAAQLSYDEAQSKLDQIGQEYSAIADQLSQTQAQVGDLSSQIDAKQAEIEQKQTEIDAKQAEVEAKQQQLGERMCSAYKSGGSSVLDILLSSATFEELTSNIYYLDKISAADQAMISEVKDLKAELESQKSSLETEKAELESQKSELETLQAQQEQQAQAVEVLEQAQPSTKKRRRRTSCSGAEWLFFFGIHVRFVGFFCLRLHGRVFLVLLQRVLDQSDDELLLLEVIPLEICLQPLEEFFRKLDRHRSHIACHFCSFFHFVIICDKLFYEFAECPARSFLLLPHTHMERCVDLRAEVFLVCHWASSFPF